MESEEAYGITRARINEGHLDRAEEEFNRIGITILPQVINEGQAESLRAKSQQHILGRNSSDVPKDEMFSWRAPLLSDGDFRTLAMNSDILSFVQRILRDQKIQLQLQNVIALEPSTKHSQGRWHRDLPYQHWVCSACLSVSVLVCLSEFNESTGSTRFIPGSHLHEEFPSEEYAKQNTQQFSARPGDAIAFNSMVFHRSGFNQSETLRVGVNHVYTLPFIKQQIDLSSIGPDSDQLSELERDLFGISFKTPSDVDKFYRRKGV